MNEQQNAAARALASASPGSTAPSAASVSGQSAPKQPCIKCQNIAAVTGASAGGACMCFDCQMGSQGNMGRGIDSGW